MIQQIYTEIPCEKCGKFFKVDFDTLLEMEKGLQYCPTCYREEFEVEI